MTSFWAFFFAPSFTICSAMKMAHSSGVQLSLSARQGSALLFSGADSTCNDPQSEQNVRHTPTSKRSS